MNIEHIVDLLRDWLFSQGIIIIIIIISTWIVSKFIKGIITKLVRRLIPRHAFGTANAERLRENTLITILNNFMGIFIWIAAFLGILYEIGVPIAPLLTGAGILGVAIGFGSQSLVRDIITGLFIIIENQFRIDDVVCIGGYCGTVEGMTLRVTKLRDIDGSIHYIPNGEIKIASNKSKDYSKVTLKIGVGYNTDLEILKDVINNVGNEIANDPLFKEFILEAPAFVRIDDFLDSAINVYIVAKVKPKEQFMIRGEMLKRIKLAFDKNKIDIPYPTSVVYNKDK